MHNLKNVYSSVDVTVYVGGAGGGGGAATVEGTKAANKEVCLSREKEDTRSTSHRVIDRSTHMT